MDIFKAAAIQMNCRPGDIEYNLGVAETMIREAARRGASLIAVPELFDTGYRVEELDRELANAIPGELTNRLTALCKELNVRLSGAVIEKSAGRLYDAAFLIGPQGLYGVYRKNALWDKEKERFSRGDDQYPVFDMGVCKAGLQICYEIGFPEGARILSLNGADVIIYIAAFGKERLYAWDLASRARGLENGNYIIACNRSGTEKNETAFAGSSRIVSPRGEILAEATQENEIILAEIDLGQIRRQRAAIPYLKDLRRNEIAAHYRL